MISSKIKHYCKRYQEEGFINSCYLLYKRGQHVIRKKHARRKILNAGQRISDKKFFELIDLKRSELINVSCALQNENYEGAKSEFIHHLKFRKIPEFFITPKTKEATVNVLLKHFPEEVKQTIRIADLICQHKFTWLTPNCPNFDGRIRWHSSFRGEREWPLDFYMDLDYLSEKRLGDVREVWELNRHQYFITLGKAYWITNNEKYAEAFIDQITDWVAKNPVGYGINWLHAQEAAIRVIAWIWAYYFFEDFPGFDLNKKIMVLQSIYEHACYIMLNLSDSVMTHNHLISEACGLAVVGIVFPEFKDSSNWRKVGTRIFEREVIKQVWEDGLHAELSTNYHCFVLDSFLQLTLLMLKNGIPVPDDVSSRIENMIETVMYLGRPDGSLPLIGDSGGGRAYRLSEYDSGDIRSYLAVGAILYNRGDFKQISGQCYEEAFWLLGENGLKSFQGLQTSYPKTLSKVFRPGGIATMRSSWDEDSEYLIFRGGLTELRARVRFSHNHADFLSFELFTKNTAILIDPGTYLYSGEDKWRFFYRQSLAHNTIVIDGQDHVDVTSYRFGIPELPLSTLHGTTFHELYDYIDMSHSGYAKSGITHRRRLVWIKGWYLLILDEILGSGSHTIEAFYHFQKDMTLKSQLENVVEVYCGEKRYLSIMPFYPGMVKLDTFRGTEDPIQGWVSPKYGMRFPAPVARYSLMDDLPVVLGTLIYSGTETLFPQLRHAQDNWVASIAWSSFVDTIVLKKSGGIHFNRNLRDR